MFEINLKISNELVYHWELSWYSMELSWYTMEVSWYTMGLSWCTMQMTWFTMEKFSKKGGCGPPLHAPSPAR